MITSVIDSSSDDQSNGEGVAHARAAPREGKKRVAISNEVKEKAIDVDGIDGFIVHNSEPKKIANIKEACDDDEEEDSCCVSCFIGTMRICDYCVII